MKHLKTFLSYACCLIICLGSFASFGKTGSEAAWLIKSYPGAKSEFEYNGALDVLCVDYETGDEYGGTINIGPDATWPEVEGNIMTLGYSASTAAQTALMALAKAAYLEAKDKFTQSRIDTLTSSVKDAFSSLDTIDIEDLSSKVTARLTKSSKTDGGAHYTGFNIFNVSGAQADGKSINSNSQDRLSLYGLPPASEAGKVPYWGGSTLMWLYLSSLFDQKTIESLVVEGTSSIANGGIQIAGWDNPTTGDHNCSPTIASMLMNGDASTSAEDNPDNHLVLTRYSASSNAELHYTRIGSLSGLTGSAIKFVGTEGDAVVGSGAKTNTVTFAKFNDCNIRIKVESDSNGNATITFGVYYK